jgi:hypothetical protein
MRVNQPGRPWRRWRNRPAIGLRPAARAERIVLAIGGVATILVAAFPLPATGTSQAHALVAGVSLTSLALWPAPAWRRER